MLCRLNRRVSGVPRRLMGGGHGHGHHHEGPHVPQFYNALGKGCLVVCFFWIMYRAKDNKGQLLGLYQPWLHEHEHAPHHKYEAGDPFGATMPTLAEGHDDHDDHDEEEHEDDDE